MSVDHYENFPVASWLCPPALRPAIHAIYRFARCADDIADEGEAPPPMRKEALGQFRRALRLIEAGPWNPNAQSLQALEAIFVPLQQAISHHGLSIDPFDRLLDAFEQDVLHAPPHDRATLNEYCSRSACPVGQLVLELHGIRDAEAIAWSDAICTGLQLVNFWQDLSIDLPRGRCYVPEVDAVRWGVAWPLTQQLAPHDQMAVDSLVEDLVSWGRQLLNQGSPLVHRLPGRSGWELRAVIQGGLRIAEKVEQNRGRHLSTRVIIQRRDVWPIALRCMAMSWQASNHARIIQ